MILVTGGTGFVGMNLLCHLTKFSTKIVALYRKNNIHIVKKFFHNNGKENYYNRIIWRKSDLENITTLDDAFEGITHVYHCAGYISFKKSNSKKLFDANYKATSNIVNFCINKKIKKLAYVSSIASLGEDESNYIYNDKKRTSYSYSKYLAEIEVLRGIEEGLPSVIINPGIIWGKCTRNSPQSKFEEMLEGFFCFYTKGKSGFVDILDVVELLIALMNSSISNERFVLVSENISYYSVLKRLKEKSHLKVFLLPLAKFWVYVLWVFDNLFSFLKFKNKTISFAFIKSIYSTKEYNGNKIIRFFPNFRYRKIF